jgi:hypothetical protein
MILDDVDAGARDPLGCLVVPDARLHPNHFRMLGENVVDMVRNSVTPPEYVDDVTSPGMSAILL